MHFNFGRIAQCYLVCIRWLTSACNTSSLWNNERMNSNKLQWSWNFDLSMFWSKILIYSFSHDLLLTPAANPPYWSKTLLLTKVRIDWSDTAGTTTTNTNNQTKFIIVSPPVSCIAEATANNTRSSHTISISDTNIILWLTTVRSLSWIMWTG